MQRLFLVLAACVSATSSFADDDRESAFRGKRLAEANCATCHAIAQFDDSPLAKALPLRMIGAREGHAKLRVMLRGSVFLKHAVMPDFEPDEQQAHDLANYMASMAFSH